MKFLALFAAAVVAKNSRRS
jgi:hypothetical protein